MPKHRHTKIKTNFKYPRIKSSDRTFGASLGQVLREDGDWRDFLPPEELQNQNGVESSACYVEASQHAIAVLQEEALNLKDQNYSARFNALLSNGTQNGGDPIAGAKSIKFDGLVPDEMMSFIGITNWPEYHSWKGVDMLGVRAKAKEFLDKWSLNFKILSEKNTPLKTKYLDLREALKRSPVPLSVCAWYEKNGEYYKPEGKRDNHFVLALYLDEHDSIHILDTYSPYLKVLAPKTQFEFALVWVVEKRQISPEQANIFMKILSLLSKWVGLIEEKPIEAPKPPVEAPQPPKEPVKSNREKLLEKAKSFLGQDASPNNYVSDEVACSESVCHILKQVIDFPMITGTWTLLDTLKKDKRFKITTEMKAGNIIISPTGAGYGNMRGHTGILLGNGQIASNTSDTGLWTNNYTIDSWVARYRTRGGMPVVLIELL